jgi:benzylsuccinate CoA-transferase BbsF subunit
MNKLPLEGIRIADFTWVGAGPYTTKIFADHGAEVIRIESCKRPDVLRLAPPFAEGKAGLNRSGYFSNRNTSKKSLTLDMSNPSSVEIVKDIIQTSDVIANSFTPGTMEKWGLGYEDVKQIKPDMIYLSMPMQGNDGPHRTFLGFGATMNALIGFNHLTGFPDGEPLGSGTNYPDHVPNPTHAAFAVLAALRHRRRTGEGQFVEVSQVESALCVIPMAIMEYANNGRVERRRGNDDPRYEPHDVYPCEGDDRWCAIAVQTPEEWKALCRMIGREEWIGDERFSSVVLRKSQKSLVDQEIKKWTEKQDVFTAMKSLQQVGVPAGVVQNAQDIIDHDPHLQEKGFWTKLHHQEMGPSIYNQSPFKLSKTPSQLRWPAPLLGEHLEHVCKDILGYSEEQIEHYRRLGVFQ